MSRVALVAPVSRLDDVLAEVGASCAFEPESADPAHPVPPDADAASLTADAHRTTLCAILRGWVPSHDLQALRQRLEGHGGSLVELPLPGGTAPPTLHGDHGVTGAFRPLVTTYATVPYHDVDPTLFAAAAYVVMFGMMFGDVGHGLLLAVAGALLATPLGERVARLRPASAFLVGAGCAATGFGLLYGEAFGPTGLVPTLWLEPLDDPEQLLATGLVVGSGLLAVSFVIATVNRWREGGAGVALYAASGIGGSLLFLGGAATVGGLALSVDALTVAGVAAATAGLALTFAGLVTSAGHGGAGVFQAVVELFDTLLRLGSNVVSFTRLAAFGLTHAVITGVVWDGTVNLWERPGVATAVAAVALLVVGNVAAFALGALVGAIQALRLEYYEMFSRIFSTDGRPFSPWCPPAARSEPS